MQELERRSISELNATVRELNEQLKVKEVQVSGTLSSFIPT